MTSPKRISAEELMEQYRSRASHAASEYVEKGSWFSNQKVQKHEAFMVGAKWGIEIATNQERAACEEVEKERDYWKCAFEKLSAVLDIVEKQRDYLRSERDASISASKFEQFKADQSFLSLFQELIDNCEASLAENDISDDRKSYRKSLYMRSLKSLEKLK